VEGLKSLVEGIAVVKNNITSIFEQKKVKIYALSLSYAAKAINRFRAQQDGNVYWDNQTNDAKNRMFSSAFIEKEVIGWFLSHGVQYGVYLESANDRQNEAILPIVSVFAQPFFDDVRKI
jgi:hypothetical protein